MNLELIISPLINTIVPRLPITLNIFNGTTVNDAGLVTPTYTTINNITAQVSLYNNQKLQHKAYFNTNKIYKSFYIQSTNLTGLNRNLNTTGDYIILQGLYYKIVEVLDNFQVGWVRVIGCESTDEVTG